MGVVLNNRAFIFFFVIYGLNTFILLCINNERVVKIFLFLRVGGLPPFLGFYPKLILTKFLLRGGLFLIMVFILFISCVDLFIYLRTSYFFIKTKKNFFFWVQKENPKFQ